MSIHCMNLQCVLYMLVKTRSFCRSSFECSKRSKSTYFTQFANIAYIQRLIPPHSRGCHHISTYFTNLHCFVYTPVKTRSLYRSSLECSNGSKSTYSTQLTKIAQLQRLIAPKPIGVSPPQMLPKRSSNASALVQSKSQVPRPLRYGATGVQSHPILVTVTACRLWPTSAPKRRPAIDPKRAFATLFHSNSRNTTAVLSPGSPWMKESPVKTATRHSLFHAHITSLFLEWKNADISVFHL